MLNEKEKIVGKKIVILAPTLTRSYEIAKEKSSEGVIVKIVVEDPREVNEISPKKIELDMVPEGKVCIYIVSKEMYVKIDKEFW